MTITDPITGEIQELPTEKPDEIRAAYQLAKRLEDTAKRIREDLYIDAKRLVEDSGDGKVYRYPDGYTLTHVSGQKFKIDPAAVFAAIGDPDMFVELVKVNKGQLEKQVATWVEEKKLDQQTSVALKKAYIPDGAMDHFVLAKEKKA